MENQEQPKKKVGGARANAGGARPGAGRPKGSSPKLTAEKLLEEIRIRSGDNSYEEILVQDFLAARDSHDKQLTLKYHNMILNKVMNTLAKVEVVEGEDAVAAKQAAFADALANLIAKRD